MTYYRIRVTKSGKYLKGCFAEDDIGRIYRSLESIKRGIAGFKAHIKPDLFEQRLSELEVVPMTIEEGDPIPWHVTPNEDN